MITATSELQESMQGFFKDFDRFINSTKARKQHYQNVQVEMFSGIANRLERDRNSIADHMMNGRVSKYIQTLAMEEMFSATSGKNKQFADRFLREIDKDEYSEPLLDFLEALPGSEIVNFRVLANKRDQNILHVQIVHKGNICKTIEVSTVVATESVNGSFWNSRLIKNKDGGYSTTQVSLCISAAEMEVSNNDETVSEFDLWVERVMQDECRNCESCKAFRHKYQEIALSTMKLICVMLDRPDNTGQSSNADSFKQMLWDTPIDTNILSLKGGVKDPRKLPLVIDWIKKSEADIAKDEELADVSTDWIWEDLGIERTRAL